MGSLRDEKQGPCDDLRRSLQAEAMSSQFELVSWMVAEGGQWEMKVEPLARLEGLGCGKGQSAESLGTVNEEAVCGHMSQGLLLRNSNDSQMEGWRQAVEAGRPAERLGSLPGAGESGSSVAEEVARVSDSSTFGGSTLSACWWIRSVGVQRGRLETDPQTLG